MVAFAPIKLITSRIFRDFQICSKEQKTTGVMSAKLTFVSSMNRTIESNLISVCKLVNAGIPSGQRLVGEVLGQQGMGMGIS